MAHNEINYISVQDLHHYRLISSFDYFYANSCSYEKVYRYNKISQYFYDIILLSCGEFECNLILFYFIMTSDEIDTLAYCENV